MKPFKFLSGYEEYDYEPLPEDTASWMWEVEFHLREVEGHEWRMETVQCEGILSFLTLFPNRYIIPVRSITGNGIMHDSHSERVGWGFDIQRELLTIEFYNLIPLNEDV